jgi:two-component system, cell cycle response regulator
MIDEGKSKKKILIAEDDPVSRHLLTNFLVKWDYDVTVVRDGTQALRILESDDTPRLAVLDWMMPGMEGPHICQHIRTHSERPYTYILLLTARIQKEDLLRGLECGADDYLTKPFDALELRARLHVGERILNLEDELRYRATHDTLTGISNRGVALEAMSREHARQVREKGSFGIILADLDHFKNINDTYGHVCGDAVLKEAAERMIGCARPYDTVGRYGGEEFLIVVTSANESVTLALAERARAAIESRPFATGSGKVHITASFGIAASSSAQPIEPKRLLQLADESLYRAKLKGRNRSEGSGESLYDHGSSKYFGVG